MGRVPSEKLHFSWKRFQIFQNTIDFVIKVGLWLRLNVTIKFMIKIYQLVTTYFFQTIIDMVYSSLHDVGVFHAASKAMMLQCLEITLLIEACMHDIRFNCAPIYIDTGILIICPYICQFFMIACCLIFKDYF